MGKDFGRKQEGVNDSENFQSQKNEQKEAHVRESHRKDPEGRQNVTIYLECKPRTVKKEIKLLQM